MENILENTTDSIWAVDKNYDVLYFNNSFRTDFKRAIGVNLKRGENILDTLPHDLSLFWKEKYDRALQGQSFTFENSFIGKNQQKIYVHVSLSPIGTKDTITGVTCFGRDITQEKLNEFALQKYSLLLESILESQKDTIFYSIDTNFKYMYFNAAHYEGMKYIYNSEISVGMNILECITDSDDRKAAIQNFTKALNGESHSNIRIYGVNNKEYYESFFNPLKDEKNKIIGVTALARNITKRINQEKALKASEKSLKEANTAKEKFFSLISHDLRSPISSITNLANLVYENFEEYDTSSQMSYLKSICESLDNTFKLLEDLLLWSTTQTNSINYNPVKINLSEITNTILDTYNQILKNKSLNVKKNYNSTFEIVADKLMISTIIRNLLSNAIKFSHNGGTIEIEFKTFSKNSIHISVCDYGVGISKENLPKVLNIGESISTLGTNNEKGTGLGLIMCKEFIDRHNGEVKIESKINEGTKVNILLPQ